MTGLFVKICGITRAADAEAAASLGASAVGFIFWPGSPRYIEPAAAADIVRELGSRVDTVGVFVDQPPEEVLESADEAGVTAVQLHGNESPDYCGRIPRRLIKAMRLKGPYPINEYGRDILILLDAADPARHGGTGRTIDWNLAQGVAELRPTILAGGLTSHNVSEAIAAVEPWGIDVSSGVESAPGIKDHAKLREFFSALPPGRARLND
jgi:phosphoribosylanthranilate isomerase